MQTLVMVWLVLGANSGGARAVIVLGLAGTLLGGTVYIGSHRILHLKAGPHSMEIGQLIHQEGVSNSRTRSCTVGRKEGITIDGLDDSECGPHCRQATEH